MKGQGHLNPSNEFVAGLFGKTDIECIVNMDCVPPHMLCSRIGAATDSFIDEAGGDEPVQFHSRQLGCSWLKHVVSKKNGDGGDDELDLSCKTGKRFGEHLKNADNEMGFKKGDCEHCPIQNNFGPQVSEPAPGQAEKEGRCDKNNHVADLGSLFKIEGFMSDEFASDFRKNVMCTMAFAKHPDVARSGNQTHARLVRFVSTVSGTMMHIGRLDGKFHCPFHIQFLDTPFFLFLIG